MIMPKVSIVTDSTAYLPEAIIRQYNITVLPLSIIWDGTSYRDGVDIQPAEFYERLQGSSTLPTTSQITAPAFQSAFSALLETGDEVLGIFLSSLFSGTYEAALQGRAALPSGGDKVAVVDSRLTTMAMALPVIVAARAAAAGESLAHCTQVAEQARDQSGVLFVPETLEFLRRGGRIGGAQALLGTVLNIKPVLGMRDGRIEAIEKIRTKTAALSRVVEIIAERIKGRTPVRLGASHAAAEADASILLAAACDALHPIETFCQPLSPVIGAHVGPGTVSLAYMTGAF
jgi:DegV family protein with EDD domain